MSRRDLFQRPTPTPKRGGTPWRNWMLRYSVGREAVPLFTSRSEDAERLFDVIRYLAASGLRRPTGTPKRPTGTWVVSCAFCDRRDHYTSDCPTFPRLSSRACKAEEAGICSNCVKNHYGVCVRRDPCTICKEEGHHRTFCVQNPRVIPDISMTLKQYYADLRRKTYRPPPPGATSRRRYSHSYKDREKIGHDESQGSPQRSTTIDHAAKRKGNAHLFSTNVRCDVDPKKVKRC